MNGPEPATRKVVGSSRQTSDSVPHSRIPSGAAIQPNGLRKVADRYVESIPSEVVRRVVSSTASTDAIFRQLDNPRNEPSSAPVESTPAVLRSTLTTMSSAVMLRPPSVG